MENDTLENATGLDPYQMENDMESDILQNAVDCDPYVELETDMPAKEEPEDTAAENLKQEDDDTEPSEEQRSGDEPGECDKEVQAPEASKSHRRSRTRSRTRSRRRRTRSRSRRRRAYRSSESGSWTRRLTSA